jgi:thioredoxin reductase
MNTNTNFDVIIIGGSYAGLSAAMALGRALRKVLIIDNGLPCNRMTPHAHNFITHDGDTPAYIAQLSREQVLQYPTIRFHKGKAISGSKIAHGFIITTEAGESFSSTKILFATGIADRLPAIKGFAECWGISALHCPYCHGYEVKHENIGILGNGEMGFMITRLLSNWTKTLQLFTNGKSTLSAEQSEKLRQHGIPIIENEIEELVHTNGNLSAIRFTNGEVKELTAVFSKIPFTQHTDIPQHLGCALTEQGFIQVDEFQRTTIPGVFAAGDNSTMYRSLSVAIGAGTKAGGVMNNEMVEETF